MDFNIEKKGYNKNEVEDKIHELTRGYEESLSVQKQRIFELKKALSEAENTIKSYKEKGSLVTKAIYNAVAKAEEIERLAKIKYNQEIEQLKAFHEKWTSYYNRILERYPLDENLAAASKFNNQMRSILARTENTPKDVVYTRTAADLEKNFEDESQRLKGRQIGYIKVSAPGTDQSNDDDLLLKEMLPDGDLNSPILSGEFDPIERINRYFSAEKARKAQAAGIDIEEYSDRSDSGFSFEEALNPKEDLSQIMKDLGLLLDE